MDINEAIKYCKEKVEKPEITELLKDYKKLLEERTDFKCAVCGYNVVLDDACYCPWCGEKIIYPHSIW